MNFTFRANNQFTLSGIQESAVPELVQGKWTSDSKKASIELILNGGTSTCELVHLDDNVLAFVIRGVNDVTGRQLISELRLRPIKYCFQRLF